MLQSVRDHIQLRTHPLYELVEIQLVHLSGHIMKNAISAGAYTKAVMFCEHGPQSMPANICGFVLYF